jgi:hypothetical protein
VHTTRATLAVAAVLGSAVSSACGLVIGLGDVPAAADAGTSHDGAPALDTSVTDAVAGDAAGDAIVDVTLEAGVAVEAGTPDGAAGGDAGVDAGVEASVEASTEAATEAGTEASVDAGPTWTPWSLPGLVLWLDAAQAVHDGTSKLVSWPDLSDAGNAGYAADGEAPLVATGVLPGRAVVQFDGNVQSVQVHDAPSLQWVTGGYLVLVVAAYTNTPSNNGTFGYGTLYAKQQTVSPFLGVYLLGNDTNDLSSRVRSGISATDTVSTTQTGYNDGKPHVFGVRRTGLTLEVIADRSTTSKSVSTDDVSAAGIDVHIGGVPPYYAALNGYVAELIAASGVVSDAELDSARTYLETKYGL